MTVSMRVMSAGEGYRYLLRSVVAGDGQRDRATPLVRYCEEAGTPPGRWLGRGVTEFGEGRLRPGSVAGESQLQLLLGMGRDPVTGAPLGRPYPVFAPGSGRHAVAGFDLTFSVPKSVSVLWGLADPGTQAWIVEAHHAAVAEIIGLLEREVAATRIGATGPDGGAVAQMSVGGVAAAAYDHWDSRAGDPQLHTHVVISNKVKTAHDGVWRSLDSKALHAALVALSEHYNAVLADRLTGTFGLAWEPRTRGADRSVAWEIAGVPDRLIAEFASRSRDIDVVKDHLIEEYVAAHGRRPSKATVVKLRAQATLATRPDKQVRSLEDLTTEWRTRAARLLRRDPTDWAHRTLTNRPARVLTAADVPGSFGSESATGPRNAFVVTLQVTADTGASSNPRVAKCSVERRRQTRGVASSAPRSSFDVPVGASPVAHQRESARCALIPPWFLHSRPSLGDPAGQVRFHSSTSAVRVRAK